MPNKLYKRDANMRLGLAKQMKFGALSFTLAKTKGQVETKVR